MIYLSVSRVLRLRIALPFNKELNNNSAALQNALTTVSQTFNKIVLVAIIV